jgi:hypothetical protein
MGKTKNEQQINPRAFSRGSGFGSLRGAASAERLVNSTPWHRAREKFTGQQGTVDELISDPLWSYVFGNEQDGEDFAKRLEFALDSDLPADKIAELVQAIPRRLDYQQVVEQAAGQRLAHFRHLLAYPTAGVREFPLHYKKPLIDNISKLIDSIDSGRSPGQIEELATDIDHQLVDINDEIEDLTLENPSEQQANALENVQLVRQLYLLLAASNDSAGHNPPSDYEEHARLADLAVLEDLWEKIFVNGQGSELESARQAVINSWREAEYQGALAALTPDSSER